MRDYIELGATPGGEDCAQVGSANYAQESAAECKRYKEMLEKMFPAAEFSIKSFNHDFGSYKEVVVWFDPDNEKSCDIAFNVERNLPETWEG